MSELTLLRIGILIAGLLLIGAIIFFGRPRKLGQGKRVMRLEGAEGTRREPTLGEQLEGELGSDGAPLTGEATTQAVPRETDVVAKQRIGFDTLVQICREVGLLRVATQSHGYVAVDEVVVEAKPV